MNEQNIINQSGAHDANLLSKQNVESYFPGTKKVNGEDTGEECLIIGVRQKISVNDLSDNDLVPAELNGVKTDVIEVAPMIASGYCGADNGATRPSDSNPNGCLGHTYDVDNTPFSNTRGGISIGRSDQNSAGTLGCIVKDSEDKLVGLTNNHVVGLQIDYANASEETSYSVTVASGVFTIQDSIGTISIRPGFDGVDFPRLTVGKKYIFNSDSTLGADESGHPFFIATAENIGGSTAREYAYTGVTIKDINETILYQDGSEMNSSGRTDPYIIGNETLELTYSSSTFVNQFYYQCWNHEQMGNRLDVIFLGVPYCFSSNRNDPVPLTEYNDGILDDAHQSIINADISTPSNRDNNANGGTGQITLGTVKVSDSIKFRHPQNNSSVGNHGVQPYNKTDCAIIELNPSITPETDLQGLAAGAFEAVAPSQGAKVYKSGRTTGVTPSNGVNTANNCTITSTNWNGHVYYCPATTVTQDGSEQVVTSIQHTAEFQDCILYQLSNEWFSDFGDSGSAILMLDESDGQHKITGLHFAGSNSLNPLTTYGVGCKISNVLTEVSSSEWNGRIQVNKSAISGSGDYVKVNNKL